MVLRVYSVGTLMIQPFAIGNRMPKDCNSMGKLQARIGRSQLFKRLQSSFAIIMRSNYIFQIIIPLAISAMHVTRVESHRL